EVGEGRRARGGHQYQPPPRAALPRLKRRPVGMTADVGAFGIIHARAFEGAVRKGKAAGFDDMRGHAEAGRGAQYGADVAGDIGLVQRDVHAPPYAAGSRKSRVLAPDTGAVKEAEIACW